MAEYQSICLLNFKERLHSFLIYLYIGLRFEDDDKLLGSDSDELSTSESILVSYMDESVLGVDA